MIDHVTKDAVLAVLLRDNKDLEFAVDLNEAQEIFGCSPEIAEAILEYFKRKGLITNPIRSLQGYNEYQLNIEAFDFANHGGFTGQEELLEKNIHKLLLEVESLKPSMPDKIKTLSEIAAAVLTSLDIMHKWEPNRY